MKRLFKKIVALGLAATMAMGMAVTSFAADETGNTVGTSSVEETVETPTFKDADGNAIGTEAIAGPWLAGNKKATLGISGNEQNLAEVKVNVTAQAPTKGKVLVAVSKTTVTEAPYADGKVVKDAEADAIVKASYKAKDNAIILKANKAAGTARVWTIITNSEKKVAAASYFDVTVKAAANKIKLTQTIGESTNDVKKIAVPVGKTVEIDITGLSKEKGTDGKEVATTDATFYAVVADKNTENVSAEVVDGKLVVKALALAKDKKTGEYTAKAVSAKVTVYCGESEKKAAVTITVTNPATDIAPEFAEGSASALLYEKDTATVVINAVTAGKDMPTTDKVKVYVAAPAAEEVKDAEGNVVTEAAVQFGLDENGKLTKFTKSKAVAAKINKDGTVTLTRKEVYEEAEIWLVYTDSATKELKLEKLAFIEKVIPTEGDVALGNDAAANYAGADAE